jgi:hypothetical protein
MILDFCGASVALQRGIKERRTSRERRCLRAQERESLRGVPNGGITIPPVYRPTPDLASNNLSWSASDVWSTG